LVKVTFGDNFPPLAGVRIVVDPYIPEDTMYAIATGSVGPRETEGMSDVERFVYLAKRRYVAMAKNIANRLSERLKNHEDSIKKIPGSTSGR
jgi:hypothetical protein